MPVPMERVGHTRMDDMQMVGGGDGDARFNVESLRDGDAEGHRHPPLDPDQGPLSSFGRIFPLSFCISHLTRSRLPQIHA